MNGGLSLIFFFATHLFVSGVFSTNFTVENKCEYTIWPGISSASSSSISITGFHLKKGEARVIQAPISWAGRFWGRTLCSTDSTGNFSCATGDCGSGKIQCAGATAKPPTTLAEFSLDLVSGQDFYDVTVVDGYNLPMVISDEELKCQSPGCVVDLNKTCPSELMVNGNAMQPIACDSACKRFRSPVFCCDGEYASPSKCQPTLYSRNFKSACPRAYSYVYDDGTSTFTCSSSSNYVITFCPTSAPPNTTTRNNNGSSVAESPLAAQTNNETLEAPSESQPPTESTATARAKKKSPWKLKLVLGISSAATLMIIIAILVIVRANRARKSDQNDDNIEAVVMLKRYSYSKVKKMTNSFANVLGRGGFGIVYKGKLPGDGRDIAVKILKDLTDNGEEFMNEVASMSRTSHVNIVSLLGFCYEGNKRAIIYEFIPNGSLDKFISEKMATKMDWKTLYNIAVGVSHGLEYLHNQCVSRIVHFDIKPQNILMDKDFVPKISDFGLAKLCKNKESIMSLLDVRGTVGYIAPEVFSKNFGGVSHKSDVYSYGMVVLEMIGARNIDNIGSNNSSSMYFPDWIYRDLEMGDKMRFFGDKIREEEEEKIAKKLVLVGLWCIQTNPSDRPSMIRVVEMLEGSLEDLQVPPKPLLGLPATTVSETVEESLEISNISAPR